MELNYKMDWQNHTTFQSKNQKVGLISFFFLVFITYKLIIIGVTQKKEFNKTNKNKKNSKVWKVEVEVREGRNR